MNGYIVTEGEADAQVLRNLLADELQTGVYIVSASVKSSAQSLARSLVAARHRPVALVLDADTTDDALVLEQRLVAREFLSMASAGVPTEVFMAVPVMEILFFSNRELLERLLGRELTDEQWTAGQFQPTRVLESFSPKRATIPATAGLLANLTPTDTAQLRGHPLIREILGFVRETMCAEATAV